jgi:hypothetical protein
MVHIPSIQSIKLRCAVVLGLLWVALAASACEGGAESMPLGDAELPTCAPRWKPGPRLTIARESAGAVVMANGDLLIVSGHPNPDPIGSADRLLRSADAWMPTGALRTPRNGIATLLALSSGEVLVAGEHGGDGIAALTGCELYDPATGTWRSTGSLHTARGLHVSALLLDGRVLVAGGLDWGLEQVTDTVEIYDLELEEWTPTASLGVPRAGHAAVMLEDGRVLVAGGRDGPTIASSNSFATAELFDPTTCRR